MSIQLEKRAFVEYYVDILGRYLAKVANMQAVTPPIQAVAGAVPGVAPVKKPSFNWHNARHAAIEEVGPAAGAVLGSTIASGYGASPLAGAALGYGVGSIPQLAYDIFKARKAVPIH